MLPSLILLEFHDGVSPVFVRMQTANMVVGRSRWLGLEGLSLRSNGVMFRYPRALKGSVKRQVDRFFFSVDKMLKNFGVEE